MSDTIAAISTAFGEAAVAVIRVSGPQAFAFIDTLWRGKQRVENLPARRMTLGALHEGERHLDDVLLTVFRAPASYTGEDMVEIAGHGGVLVVRRILEAILRAGARSAEPGEFTRRAYRHGKLDLTQAEAVMDVIRAQTDLALRVATEQLEGRLGSHVRTLRTVLLETLAHVEASIDFSHEDIAPDSGPVLRNRLAAALVEVEVLLATAGQGKVLREGVRTVITGAPNAGKSSLLNLLLGFDRAIVSAQPGTTRDVIEETIVLKGIPLRLADTAGLRDTEDAIEQAGIDRARRALAGADLVIEVVDASLPAAESLTTGAALRVLNKCDLGVHPSWAEAAGVRLSCSTEEGMDALVDAIVHHALHGAPSGEWNVAINARHQQCLERARDYLHAAIAGLDAGASFDLVAEDIRATLNAVGDVVGRPDNEQMLDVLFGQFCIGK